MNKYITALCFIFIFYSAYSQQTISSTAFLKSATSQDLMQLSFEKQYLNTTDYTLPFLQKLEFRTETNDFIWREQEYALRAAPTTKRQRNAQQEYHLTRQSINNIESDLALKEALLVRYEWLVKVKKQEHSLKEKNELLALCKDRLSILGTNINELDFKVKDLIKAEEELQELEYDIFVLNNKEPILNKEGTSLLGRTDSITLSTNDLVTIERIVQILGNTAAQNHTELTRKRMRAELSSREYEIELSAIKNYINFAQVKVRGGNNQLFREWLSVGVALKLPVRGDKKFDLNDLELERIEELNELTALESQLIKEQSQLKEEILQLVTRKEYLQKQLDNSQSKYVLEQLLKSAEADPIDILDLKEILVKKELAIQKIDIEVLELYIKWLDASDKVMEKPLRNYLVKSQETIFD